MEFYCHLYLLCNRIAVPLLFLSRSRQHLAKTHTNSLLLPLVFVMQSYCSPPIIPAAFTSTSGHNTHKLSFTATCLCYAIVLQSPCYSCRVHVNVWPQHAQTLFYYHLSLLCSRIAVPLLFTRVSVNV